jgi:purine-nucleoside phosphorylase
MLDLRQKIDEAAAYIQAKWNTRPKVGIILGTGLGGFAREVQNPTTIPYADIPHFPKSTAIGHKGQLVCGLCNGVPVATMEGRFHSYEGYNLQQVTLPVRVMHKLGIELLIVSNAAGGMNPHFKVGDVMLIEDHINLMGDNPLLGYNDPSLGPRFPDMSEAYDRALIDRALEIARKENFVAHRGVYVALKGPNYETRAEYRFLRIIGGDVVGMSTVPEVIVAAHESLKVMAISAVTNVCLPDALEKADGESVVEAGKQAEPKMRKIVLATLGDIAAKSKA